LSEALTKATALCKACWPITKERKADTLCKAGCSLNLNPKASATVQGGQANLKELLMEATFI
jgi:hypothetical protein